MQTRQLIAGVLLVSGLCFRMREAAASLFEPVSDSQLVCETTDVVHGQVSDVQAAWDEEHSAIWTTATVQVGEAIRGGMASNAAIKVKEVGGTVEGYTIKAEGFPSFRAGDEVVLLLQPWDDGSGTYRVWGYGRGMFSVSRAAGQAPGARRYDVVESGRATMFTDRIPPTLPLDALHRELGALSRACKPGGRP